MRGSTLPFALIKTYGSISINLREKWNPLFNFLFLSLLFVSPFFVSLPPLFLLFFSFPPYPPALPYFVCYPSHLFFIFLFFFSFFIFPFLFFFFTLLTVWIKVGETSHHFPPLPPLHFFLDFSLFSFPSFSSTWHLAQCEPFAQVHHMDHAMCHSPRVPCGIHMIIPYVTRYLVSRKT